MKHKTGLIALAALLALPAWATDREPNGPPDQWQDQTQFQHMNQAQEQSASANNEGVQQAVNFQDRRQAPASFAPAIAPTAPCYYSVGGALSIPGGSIGGGKALLDKGCQLREEIRLAYQLGLVAEADYLFCSGPGKDIPGCGQRARAAPPEPQPTVVVITGESCGGKDRERAERIIERCVGK